MSVFEGVDAYVVASPSIIKGVMGDMISRSAEESFYLAQPNGVPKAAVLVIHEVWGLADHIKSVADRLASEGYLALAPDLLIGSGVNIPELSGLQEGLFDPARRNAVQPKMRELMTPMNNPEFSKRTLLRLTSSFNYLFEVSEVGHRVAVVGFCFGGTYTYSLVVNEPRLRLAVPFYGHCDFSVEELARINCPVRAFYGEKDDGLRDQTEALPAAMSQAGVDYSQKVYPDCGHAFFNDTNRFAYYKPAADDAWQILLSELSKI